MTWLTNFVRPKIRALVGRSADLPDNLWIKCTNCEQMIFHRDLEANLMVCTHCEHHLRMGALARMATLFDEGAFQTIELPRPINDPLKFRDGRRYSERLKEAQSKTGLKDAMAVAHGRMGGQPVVVACLGFEFMGGSMGMAVGEALIAASRLASLQRAALIVVTSSGGARMQEGILSLMQMPRTTIAVREVKEAGLPYIVVLADPTTGGVSASFAMLGDITLGEPGAVIGFAGARVISETIREKLPEGFQRAEYLLDHGMIDMVVPRQKLRDTLIRVLGLLRNPAPAGEVVALPPVASTPPRQETPPDGSPAE